MQAEELKARLQREKEEAELARAKKEESSDDVRKKLFHPKSHVTSY